MTSIWLRSSLANITGLSVIFASEDLSQIDQPFCVSDGIATGPVNLRNTAKCVSVLNIRRIMPTDEFASCKYFAQMSRAVDLTWMRPESVNSLIKSGYRSVQSLKT